MGIFRQSIWPRTHEAGPEVPRNCEPLLKPDIVPVGTSFDEIAKWSCKWQDCCLE
jgi:hypothetical protein